MRGRSAIDTRARWVAPFHDAWPDAWPDIEPLVERLFAGESLRSEDLQLVRMRHGLPEDTTPQHRHRLTRPP
jgi:hypothetical protein